MSEPGHVGGGSGDPARPAGRVGCVIDASGVAVITLDRPPVNALSSAMYLALGDAADQIAGDERVRVAILTGAGGVFSAGADVRELASHSPKGREAFFAITGATRRKVDGIPVPVIAAINGAAAGAGVAYATMCDYRIAADTAFLAMPEIDRGSVATGGINLKAVGVPPGALRFMLFTGRRVPATEAVAIHLVDEVVPAGRLLAVAYERALAIAAKPRHALVAMKRAIREVSGDGRQEELYATTQAMTIDLIDRPETRAGLDAFAEHGDGQRDGGQRGRRQ